MRSGFRFAAVLAALLLAASAVLAAGQIQDPALLEKIKPGITTAQDVEQILGPPKSRTPWPRMDRVSMDYVMRDWSDTYDVAVMVDGGGIVREVEKVRRVRY